MASDKYPPITKQAIPEGMAWMERIISFSLLRQWINPGIKT
jgi:hypothetical protein